MAILSLSAINSFAAITDVAIYDNTITITGTDLGANAQDFEWTGDNIEAGTIGGEFTKAKWSSVYTEVTYTNVDKHSGSKAIVFPYYSTYETRWMQYDHGNTSHVKDFYVSCWVKLVKNDDNTTFQWKNWRIKDTPGYAVETGVIGDFWYNGAWYNNDLQIYINGIQSGVTNADSDAYLLDEWQRIDTWYRSSEIDGTDGQIEIRRIGRTSGEVIDSMYNVTTHTTASANDYYRYLLIGMYYGNLIPGTTRDMKYYYDDIYIAGTRQRVEIGNASTFSACTHREIQPATAWSDTGITGTFNRGSFEVGDTVYVFVVDEDGIPSDGCAAVIGGEPSIANPIVEILTESGQTTTASVFAITGTATADTGQTISGVTCSGQTVTPDDGTWDEQEEAFTCLANLALGENTLVFVGSDGTRPGQDSISVTRTAPSSITNTSVSRNRRTR